MSETTPSTDGFGEWWPNDNQGKMFSGISLTHCRREGGTSTRKLIQPDLGKEVMIFNLYHGDGSYI